MSQDNNALNTGLITINNSTVNGRNEKYPLAFEMRKGEATVAFEMQPLKNNLDTFLTIYQYNDVETIRSRKLIRSSNESRVCPYGFMLVGFFYVYR